MLGSHPWVLAVIYTSNFENKKKGLWNILECVCNQDLLVLVIGNYNVIFIEGKKKGE